MSGKPLIKDHCPEVDLVTQALELVIKGSARFAAWFPSKYNGRSVWACLRVKSAQSGILYFYDSEPVGFSRAQTERDLLYGSQQRDYKVVENRSGIWLYIELPEAILQVGPGTRVDDRHYVFPMYGYYNPFGQDILVCSEYISMFAVPSQDDCPCKKELRVVFPSPNESSHSLGILGPLSPDLQEWENTDWHDVPVNVNGEWTVTDMTFVHTRTQDIAKEGPQGYDKAFDVYDRKEERGVLPPPLPIVHAAATLTEYVPVVPHQIRPGEVPTVAPQGILKVKVSKATKRVVVPVSVRFADEVQSVEVPDESRVYTLDDLLRMGRPPSTKVLQLAITAAQKRRRQVTRVPREVYWRDLLHSYVAKGLTLEWMLALQHAFFKEGMMYAMNSLNEPIAYKRSQGEVVPEDADV